MTGTGQNERRRIKIVLNEQFSGMNSGWPTRYIGIIRELARNHELFVYAPGHTELLKEVLPQVWVAPSQQPVGIRPRGNIFQFVASLIRPYRHTIMRPDFVRYRGFEEVLRKDTRNYDAVLYFGMSGYIMYHDERDGDHVLCDFCDSRTREMKSKLRYQPFRKRLALLLEILYVKRIKRALLPPTLTGLAITEQDALEIRKAFPGKMLVVRNGIRVNAPKSDDDMESAFRNRRVLFLGSLDFAPNVQAVEALADVIWPQVASLDTGLALDIVGRNPSSRMESAVARLQHACLHKNVADTAQYYRAAMFFVAPIYIGAGMKNKLLEALAVGTPIITTREAAKGIDLVESSTCFFADDNDQFVTRLQQLSTLDWETYRAMSRACVELARQYQWDKTVKPLLDHIDASPRRSSIAV